MASPTTQTNTAPLAAMEIQMAITYPRIISGRDKDDSWLFDEEKPMQTAAGRRKLSMPESVTGNYPKLVDKSANHDAMLTRGSDAAFGPDEREWTARELADYEKWHSSLPGRLIDYYA